MMLPHAVSHVKCAYTQLPLSLPLLHLPSPPHSADPTLSDTPCFLQKASFAHSGNYISRVRRTHPRKDIIKRLLLQNSYSAT